jgi:beta-lactam-binding protein with PASTA domain
VPFGAIVAVRDAAARIATEGWPRAMTTLPRRGCTAVALAAIAVVLAACGSSSPSGVAMPSVTGEDLARAAGLLCAAGLRVDVRETSRRGGPGAARGGGHGSVTVASTTPPAGASVARGTVVVIHVVAAPGVAALIRLPAGCGATVTGP